MIDIQENTPKKKRILLVDDTRDVRDLIRSLLLLDSHEVVEANNGAEAINLFTQSDFDLVMTDYKMPFINGIELAEKIKALSPFKPILLISGYGRELGRCTWVDAILDKPFSFEKLRAAVKSLLAIAEG